MRPSTLILRTAGTNCDRELAYAFEQAGADTQTIHLNQLIERPELLDRFDLIGVPGGFSYGDDIAAGRIFANRLRRSLYDPLRSAIDRGTAIIGICNGFQVLVKMGLLPNPLEGRQTATLAENACGRFIDRWVRLEAPDDTVCVWTRGLGRIELPIAHGEGRFVAESAEALMRWSDRGQIALRYAADDNPNGSVANVAGLCDPTGLVLGLMPHPERCIHPTNHPDWASRPPARSRPSGLMLLSNAVRRAAETTVTRS